MKRSARSSKAKGRRLQNYVRDMLRDVYTQLHPDDIKSQTMGMTGEDIVRTPAAKEVCAFSFECKNVERLQIWKAIEQCETNRPDCSAPAIVFKKNGKEPYVAIPFTVFCDMLQYENERYVDGESKQSERKIIMENGSSSRVNEAPSECR